MASTKIKIESGMQLLARLTRKPEIENFYPVLFQSGPKSGDMIEISSDISASSLLIELITESLIPSKFGGVEAGVLFFNTDGNLNYVNVIEAMKKKIVLLNSTKSEYNDAEVDNILHETLGNFYMLEIYDANQLYITIQNLENILTEYSNISLIIFDTLTAFYWSEQGYHIAKMDLYVKKLLGIIQKVTKEYKIVCIYTKPEYFSSNKELSITDDHLNYRIKLDSFKGNYKVDVKVKGMQFTKNFYIHNGDLKWL